MPIATLRNLKAPLELANAARDRRHNDLDTSNVMARLKSWALNSIQKSKRQLTSRMRNDRRTLSKVAARVEQIAKWLRPISRWAAGDIALLTIHG
jgi:hypothetical protein